MEEFKRGRLLLTVDETAEQLGIGRTTLYGLIAAKSIRPVRIGRLTRFTTDEIEAFVRRLAVQDDGR